jgi:SAM-dependent methyltransferase
MPANIAYVSPAIAAYFGSNRRRWDQFYPSERWIIDRVAERRRGGSFGHVLDVGSACGGLGAALAERHRLEDYTGIDINIQAIEAAAHVSDIPVPHCFVRGDISADAELPRADYDTVFSLGCADWNLDPLGIIAAAWRRVAPGGNLIISLRLSEKAGVRTMDRSFQYIHFGDPDGLAHDAERAAYVVLNVSEALAILGALQPSRVMGYGYWAKPSATARTPFDRLAFTVFAVEKNMAASDAPPILELHLPWDIWKAPLGS